MKTAFGDTVVLSCIFGFSDPLLLVYDGEVSDVLHVDLRSKTCAIRFTNGEVYEVAFRELEPA